MIVVQDKNTTGEVRICVDLRKMNDSCLHVPFSTSFTDEVLESVRGQEVYSLLMGYLATIIFESRRNIDTSQPLRQSGDVFNT